ncbi:MAG TPA: aldose 1-epimerase [Terracidiphilus sp.]|nr:aldose 1-epimerase [Terracidiphilus sp.]
MRSFSFEKRTVEGHAAYHLFDGRRNMELRVVPEIGNWIYQFRVNGKDVLFAPESLERYVKERALGWGNPLMAPFANRIDRDHYFFDGKKYLLNGDLGNFLRDPQSGYPIHGLLAYDPRWEVTQVRASDSGGAVITSRLEFYKHPDLMAQFPFAHVHEVTYRLKSGKLECATQIRNLGRSAMPVHFGYHPYFVLDGPREDWTLHVAAQSHWIVTSDLIPTGELEPAETYLPGCLGELRLGRTFIDAGFTDFDRDKYGRAHFWVKGKTQKIDLVMDSQFTTAVIFAPLNKRFVCIEPQTGPTNAFNLRHEGKIEKLRTLAPGETFRSSYWIVPAGY